MNTPVFSIRLDKKDKLLLAGTCIPLSFINILSWNFPVFWDSILHSRIAIWFFENGFSSLKVPADMDALHPPGFALLLASSWEIFGQNLWISHLIILPFSLGIAWQMLLLIKRFVPSPRLLPFLIIFLEPCLLSQMTEVSPDIILVFFYFFGLNAMLSGKKTALAVAVVFLSLFHFRGALMAPSLWLTGLWLMGFPKSISGWIKTLLPFSPALILIFCWVVWHYFATGWLLRPPDETYGTTRKIVGASELIRNMAVLVFRYLDNGRAILWLIILPVSFWLIRTKHFFSGSAWIFFRMMLVPLVGIAVCFLPFSIPLGHRYFLVSLMMLPVLALLLIRTLNSSVFRTGLTGMVLLGLLSGHFWIFPDTVSKGWDSTLAHISWFQYRKEAVAWIKENHIDSRIVCSDFPNVQEIRFSDLDADTTRFSPKEKGLSNCSYVFWSNVLNGFSDDELSELKTDWDEVKSWGDFPVRVKIYRRKVPGLLYFQF